MLVRLVGWLTVAALVSLVFVSLIARAIDVETQDRVIFTREDGVTLDCARHFGAHGNVAYGDCHRVP